MADEIGLKAIIGADVSGFQRGTAQARGGINNLMGDLTKLGSIIGATIGGAAVISGALELDRALTNIRTVTGATKTEMAGLNKELLGIKSPVGIQDTSKAFYDIVSGVADATTRTAAFKAALATAEAGQAEMTGTTKGLIQAMNAYGFAANQAMFASDVFTRTVAIGVGEMDDFVAAMGPIIGISAQIGVKFNDLGAAMAFLTTKGLNTAKAGTTLQASMMALLNPNEKLIKLFKQMGVESGTALIKSLGLAGAINKIKAAAGGSNDKLAQLLGSTEALQAAVVLTGGDFEAFAKTFEDGLTGATEAARQLQLESPSAQLEIFKNELESLGISIAQMVLPGLGKMAEFLGGLLTAITTIDPTLVPLIASLGLLAGAGAALGPVLTILAGIAGPVAAIGTAAVAMKAAWDTNFGGLRTTVEGAYNAVKPALDNIKKAVDYAAKILFGETPETKNPFGIDIEDFSGKTQAELAAMPDLVLPPAIFQEQYLDIKGKLKINPDDVRDVWNDALGGAKKATTFGERLSQMVTDAGPKIKMALLDLGQSLKETLISTLQISPEAQSAIEAFFSPLSQGFKNLQEVNWGNVAIAGLAVGVFAVGVKGLGLAFDVFKGIVIFEALTLALKQISEGVDALKINDVGGALVHFGVGIGAVGIALAIGNIGSLGTVATGLVKVAGVTGLSAVATGLWALAGPILAIAAVSAAFVAVATALNSIKAPVPPKPVTTKATEAGLGIGGGGIAPVTFGIGAGPATIGLQGQTEQTVKFEMEQGAQKILGDLLAMGVPMDAALKGLNERGVIPAETLNTIITTGLPPGTTLQELVSKGILPAEAMNTLAAQGIPPSASFLNAMLHGIKVDWGTPPTIGGPGSGNPPERASGGSTGAGIYKVTEGGQPEMFDYGGSRFLMSPGEGYVTPVVSAPASGGGRGGGGNTYQVYITVQSHNTVETINQELARQGLPPLQEIARGARG